MKTYKTAIITGAIALVAVIATIIVLNMGNAGSGLYISAISGDVQISAAADGGATSPAAADTYLSNGDILTVNEGASCRLVYRSKKNTDDSNYIVLEPSTQIFITGDFKGKSDSEIFLNRGAVFINSLNACPANVIVRTESSSYVTKETVIRIAYEINDTGSLTKAASFAGNSEITLYDNIGNLIDRNGYKLQSPSPEILGSGRTSIVVSGDAPSFESLNVPAVLSEYSASTLRELFTASTFGTLAFSAEEIKAAYDNAPDEMPSAPEATQTETIPSETETSSETEAVTIETTIPDQIIPVDEETTTTTPFITQAPVTTTTPAPTTTQAPVTTTTAPQTTTAAPETTETESSSSELIPVYIFIEDEVIYQEVEYGGSASQPSVPEIPGKKFIGWDGDFNNITSETNITAIFEDIAVTEATTTTPSTDFENPFDSTETATATSAETFIVNVVINGQSTSQIVSYGGKAILPEVAVPGFIFLGWDGDGSYVTSNMTITAILVPDPAYENNSSITTTVTTTAFADVTL